MESKYLTISYMLDINHTYSFHHPIDDTVVRSIALARDDNFQILFAMIGGGMHRKNAPARIILQLGRRLTFVPRNGHNSQKVSMKSRYLIVFEAIT
jgi:hypothetical protein